MEKKKEKRKGKKISIQLLRATCKMASMATKEKRKESNPQMRKPPWYHA